MSVPSSACVEQNERGTFLENERRFGHVQAELLKPASQLVFFVIFVTKFGKRCPVSHGVSTRFLL